MNVIKLILAAMVIGLIIFMFTGNLPGKVEINGHILEANENNSSFNSNLYDALTYSNPSSNNHLMLMLRKNEEITLQDLKELILNDLTEKGFKFSKKGSNHLGINGNQGMYLTIAQDINALALYSETSNGNFIPKPEESFEIFYDLVNLKN